MLFASDQITVDADVAKGVVGVAVTALLVALGYAARRAARALPALFASGTFQTFGSWSLVATGVALFGFGAVCVNDNCTSNPYGWAKSFSQDDPKVAELQASYAREVVLPEFERRRQSSPLPTYGAVPLMMVGLVVAAAGAVAVCRRFD